MVGNVVSGALRSGEVLDRSRRNRFGCNARAKKSAGPLPTQAKPTGSVSPASARCSAAVPIRPSPWSRSIARAASALLRRPSRSATGSDRARGARGRQARNRRRRGEARRARWLGRARAGDAGNPFTITRDQQDAAAKNPRWVPDVAQDTTASVSAHVHTAVAAEAANVVLRFGIWPAALASGRLEISAARQPASTCVSRRAVLSMAAYRQRMEPLALPRLAAKAHKMGLVTAAMVHGYNRWSWAHAAFDLPDGHYAGAIDALAVKYGADRRHARR